VSLEKETISESVANNVLNVCVERNWKDFEKPYEVSKGRRGNRTCRARRNVRAQ
jgi:hypothetical protein